MDKIVDGELRLPDEPSQIFIFSQTPGSVCRKKHGRLLMMAKG
jgi:hypothetical protein